MPGPSLMGITLRNGIAGIHGGRVVMDRFPEIGTVLKQVRAGDEHNAGHICEENYRTRDTPRGLLGL